MRINKIIIIYLIFLFLSCYASALDKNDLSNTGFYLQPDAIIKKLSNEKAGYKEHFLLGISHKKIGNKKNAIYHFANSCFTYSKNTKLKLYPSPVYNYINEFHIKSIYYDDSVYEIALSFFEYREFEYVIKFIDLIDESNTALYRDAVILKTNALMESGKYDTAISELRSLLNRYRDNNSKSIILIRLASAYEKNNTYEQAIREYLEILKLNKKSWQSGIACKRILGISSQQKFDFNGEDKLLLGISLFYNSKKDSIEILEELYGSGTEEIKNEVLKLLINAYTSNKQIKKADQLISEHKKNTSAYFELLKIKADALWSINKKRAFNIYKKLFFKAEGIIQKESHKKIAVYLLDKNENYKDLLINYKDKYLKDKYPKDNASDTFLWALAKDCLKDKDYSTAIKYIEESLTNFPDSPYSGKYRFWLIELYSMLGRNDDAANKLKELVLVNPDSSYTWKVLEKINKNFEAEELNNKFKEAVESQNIEDSLFYHTLLFIKEKDLSKRNERINSLNFIDDAGKYKETANYLNEPETAPELKHILKATEIYFITGYIEGIIRETGLIPEKVELQTERYKILAFLGSKYNNFYFASVSILNLLKQNNIKENIAILPNNVIEKLYPKAFEEHVEKACAEYEIQNEILYAVMKAESSFNHSAVSPAGAAGLMQLMPATAAEIAKEMKLKNYNITDPVISITLGAKYYSWLNKYFKGDFIKIIAGYNAGPGNVRKWTNGNVNPDDEDLFIELIPFPETRHYVLRIQKYFILYKLIYGESDKQ